MPKINIPIGSMTAVYVGAAGGSGLTRISHIRTKGIKFSYTIPELFYDVLGTTLPGGRASFELTMSFLSTNDKVLALAMGNAITSGTPDGPSTFTYYSVLLVHPNENEKCLYIPTCYTRKNLLLNWDKTTPTEIPVTFTNQNRLHTAQLFELDLLSNLSVSI